MLRNILAVIAGLVTIVGLSAITDNILQAIGIFPPPDQQPYSDPLLFISLVYRLIYAYIGGVVTAKMAKRKMTAIMMLILASVLIVTINTFFNQDMSESWYPTTLVILSVIAIIIASFKTGRPKSKATPAPATVVASEVEVDEKVDDNEEDEEIEKEDEPESEKEVEDDDKEEPAKPKSKK